MIVFLSGPMTGHPDYNRAEFNRVAAELTKGNPNLIVLNPAVFPDGMPHESYMVICRAMIDVSNTTTALPGWETSKGAQMEKEHTLKNNKLWLELKDARPDLFDPKEGGKQR